MSAFILRLDGLPFRISEEEITEFFADCQVKLESIHLLLNREQRPSGTGYVTFENETDGKNAFQKNGKTIGDSKRYVKLVRTDQEELDWQLRRQQVYQGNDPTARFYSVRMFGIPYKTTEYEIAKWISTAADCMDVQVHLNHQGRPSGDATAYFDSEETAKKALTLNGNDMKGRYINLSMDNVSVSFSNASGSPNAIRLSGLPFRATEQEIKDFFMPEAECTSVRVILNRDGRPSGDAIAEFATEEIVDIAMKKDREHLGSRFVVLTREKDVSSQRNGGNRQEPGTPGRFSIKMGGIPYSATVDQIIDWFLPEAECVNAKILRNRDNRPSGEALAEFATEDEARVALTKNKQYMGERFVVLTPQRF